MSVLTSVIQASRGSTSLTVSVVHDYQSLESHLDAWNDLVSDALEPNPFYEPWILLPAVRNLAADKDLLFVLVWRNEANGSATEKTLCALFPLERTRRFKGLPVSALSIWDFGHCSLATPLVRKSGAQETLKTFFHWLQTDAQSSPLIAFRRIPGEGPLFQHLTDLFRQHRTTIFLQESWTRAFLRRRDTAQSVLDERISSNRRRDLNRKQRRLQEQGTLDWVSGTTADELEDWVESFLSLEHSGWKGEQGSALACRPANRSFFREIMREGFAQEKLLLGGLYLNRQPIALRCSFLSGNGSFFFKPAYDEALGPCSPGALLEVETIRQLHRNPDIHWMDSCTNPDNSLLNTLWPDRLIIQDLVIATGKRGSQLILSSLPFLRWLKSCFSPPREAPAGSPPSQGGVRGG